MFVTTKEDDNVGGSWVVVNSDVTLAAFLQDKVPAVGIYVKQDSDLFLVLQEANKVVVQFRDKEGGFHFITETDLQHHVDYKKKEAAKKTKDKDKEPATPPSA